MPAAGDGLCDAQSRIAAAPAEAAARPPSCKRSQDAGGWEGSKVAPGCQAGRGMNEDLLDLLVCPEDHSRLHLADPLTVGKLNAAIAAGRLKNRAGVALTRPARHGPGPRRRQAGLSRDRRHSAHAGRRGDSAGSIAALSHRDPGPHAMAKTIFKRIIDGEIPAKIIYQDDRCLAFHDVAPQAPTHVLVIPKARNRFLERSDARPTRDLIGHIALVIQRLAAELKLAEGIASSSIAGQTAVKRSIISHFHLLGGRQMTWPPG